MKTISFHVFAEQGGLCDGDFAYFGRKGMGIIQIEPMPDVTVFSLFGLKSIDKLYRENVTEPFSINPSYMIYYFQIDVFNTHTNYDGIYQSSQVIYPNHFLLK